MSVHGEGIKGSAGRVREKWPGIEPDVSLMRAEDTEAQKGRAACPRFCS